MGVFMGNTMGAADDFTPSCRSDSTAPDRVHLWAAPSPGCYRFDTVGSDYDTVLALYSQTSCDPMMRMELACNDDIDPGMGRLRSYVCHEFAMPGDQVLVVVDGFGSAAGSYRVNVTRIADGSCPPMCPPPSP